MKTLKMVMALSLLMSIPAQAKWPRFRRRQPQVTHEELQEATEYYRQELEEYGIEPRRQRREPVNCLPIMEKVGEKLVTFAMLIVTLVLNIARR